MMYRWWIYQKERFPVFQYGLLVISVCLAALIFSRAAGGRHGFPPLRYMLTAIVSTFLFFLQLRILDEFKDFSDDLQYRAYRPVPRGLVHLAELKIVFVAAAGIQLGLALWLNPRMLLPLIAVWSYMLLMRVEFFAGKHLKKLPVLYLISHMLIMPLIYFYITACNWLAAGHSIPKGLPELLAMGFTNGFVIEIGRKIRPTKDEEVGVETYSLLWGPIRASVIWIASMFLAALFAVMTVQHIHFRYELAYLIGSLLLAGVMTCCYFYFDQVGGSGKRLEKMAGIWVFVLHLGIAGNLFLRT